MGSIRGTTVDKHPISKRPNKKQTFIFLLEDFQQNYIKKGMEVKILYFTKKIPCNRIKYLNDNLYFILQNIRLQNCEMPLQRPSLKFKTSLLKIQQLLRLYRMVKKSDTSKKLQVQKLVRALIKDLQQSDEYLTVKNSVQEAITNTLKDPKITQIKSILNKNLQSKALQKKALKNQKSISIVEQPKTQKLFNQSTSKPLFNTSQVQQFSSFSTQKSQQKVPLSLEQKKNQLKGQLQINQNRISQFLAINEDIPKYLSQTEKESYVYLFGVNTPEKKVVQKIYLCTLMQFSLNQTNSFSENFAKDGNIYMKQEMMFQNSLRTPMGLILCGDSITSITAEQLKFCVEMGSFQPIIILLESFNSMKGKVYVFPQKICQSLKQINKIQYPKMTSKIQKQYKDKYIQLTNFSIVKDKLIITKNFPRTITNNLSQIGNAIQISMSNQYIKEEQNQFPYKFHSKFYNSSKCEFQVFFIEENIVKIKINYKDKQFANFQQFVLQEAAHKGKFILSTSVVKQSSEIKKQFLELLIKSNHLRQPFFLINLSTVMAKRTNVLTLKPNLTLADIQAAPSLQFKTFETSNALTNWLFCISKHNYKEYQSKEKVEAIQIIDGKKKK